ncbi:MAG: UPF0175 family protein [Chloroflexia bacterium]|nr:UPF0175 family protein [Chloroflexia bacterium]
MKDNNEHPNIPVRIAGRACGASWISSGGGGKAKESLVLELLREERISQGQAARLLGVIRWEIIQLMGRYRIPSRPETAEDVRQELDDVSTVPSSSMPAPIKQICFVRSSL